MMWQVMAVSPDAGILCLGGIASRLAAYCPVCQPDDDSQVI